MDTLFADFRHATRTLRRSPAFTLAALATLAIGIGATASIFSVVNGVLLQPLPLPDPDRIVTVRSSQLERGWLGASLAGPDFADVRAQDGAFETVTAAMMRNVEVTGRGDPAEMTAAIVSRDFFRVIPVTPLVGRLFVPDEFQGSQSPNTTIITEGVWRTRFGADRAVIGQSVTINGTPRTIVGVVPEAASWPRPAGGPDFFIALPELFQQMQRGAHMLEVIGRLKPTATLETARTELATLAARQARDFPQTNRGWLLTANLITEEVVGGVRPALLVLLGAVGFVLLIVCANVASLLVARASARHHEIAIRRALGASSGRIARHLAAESVLLAVGGGFLGVLVSLWGVDLLRRSATETIPRIASVRVDASVLMFTVAIAAFTALVCGVLPAFSAARGKLPDVLKEGARVAAPRRGRIGRGALVIGEITLAVVLLAGAGLMARSFDRMRSIPLGFDPGNVIAIDLDLPMSRYQSLESREQLVKQVEARIRRLPGVIAVGTTRALPLESGGPDIEFTIDGKPTIPKGQLGPNAFYTAVTPDYFRAMGMTVVRGRGLIEADDHPTASRVVIVNETARRRFWGAENPVGQHLTLHDGTKAEVVGILKDVRQRFLTNEVNPQMFVAWSQAPEPQVSMVVRTAVDPTTLVDAMHRDIWAVDPSLPVEEWTLAELMDTSLEGSKFQTTLLVSFATVALILAAMGVYALVSYAVTQRTREIGVRMALGAARSDVVTMVLRQGARLTIAGVALGLLNAFFLTRVMRRVLYDVSPSDPLVHTLAAVLLGVVAVIATYIPARRAATVDPVVALRDER
jgi:putative ABC transport system permease protein